ncbi:MAG: ATP-binding protein [bacterium]|nr:ATP-binding protein [bacterium]
MTSSKAPDINPFKLPKKDVAADVSFKLPEGLDENYVILKTVVEGITDALYVKDIRGRFVLINEELAKRWKDDFNLDRESIIGHTNIEIFPQSHTPLTPTENQVIESGEAQTGEEQITLPKTKETRTYFVRQWPYRDQYGNITGLIGISRDVTGYKHQETRQLLLSNIGKVLSYSLNPESTLQNLANLIIPDLADWCLVSLKEEGGTIRTVTIANQNPTRVSWAQEAHEKYEGDQNPLGAARVIETGRSELYPHITEEMIRAYTQDKGHVNAIRSLNICSVMIVPMNVHNHTLGAITFMSCRQNRPYTKEDLECAEEIAHRAAIAIDNAKLYQEIRRADQAKDEFLATLAHELRNPLAPILSSLEFIKMSETKDPELIKSARMMERQIQNMSRLLDDLLDLSRITSGKVTLQKELLDVRTIINQAAETAKSLFENRQHTLEIKLPDKPILIQTDPLRLEQIIVNILNNAAKYTEPQGKIELTCSRDYQEIMISIRDSGIGIPAAMLTNIFEPFTQVDHSITHSQGGLGIGLKLVKTLVELHGGTIEAHSSGLNQGSEFIVRLPSRRKIETKFSKENLPQHKESSSDQKGSAGQSRKILVVDDNQDAAISLGKLLGRLGHSVEVAHDGPSAINTIRTYHPDIVLLDIGLPNMNGYEVARRIREDKNSYSPTLVALTGYGQEEDKNKAKEAGFDHHITKPVGVSDLQLIITNQPSPSQL